MKLLVDRFDLKNVKNCQWQKRTVKKPGLSYCIGLNYLNTFKKG